MRERQSRAQAQALAAGIVAGLALWCTRGGLEVVAGPNGPLRVALLPSGWQALSLIAAMAGAALGLAHAVAWAGGGDGRAIAEDDADVTRPLFASGVLVLPFLPWLADTWPALTVLGGRFALVVWFVVGALTLRAALLRIRGRAGSTRRCSDPVAVIVARRAAPLRRRRLALRRQRPVPGRRRAALSGARAEPVARSRLQDREQPRPRRHVRVPPAAAPAALSGARSRRRDHSIHPVGLAIIAAPIYAAGGYYGVVALVAAARPARPPGCGSRRSG